MAKQFLDVVSAERARELLAGIVSAPVEAETVPLSAAFGRVLATDVFAGVDVPGFDRANLDGFAVRAADTYGATESAPVVFSVTGESLAPGELPQHEVATGQATTIATGSVLPRGADAIIKIEDTEEGAGSRAILVQRALTPGSGVSFAGSDMARGEMVLRRGSRLTARETGVLAAIGADQVDVHRRPRVALFSTGGEIVAPGAVIEPGEVYDSNLRILADTLREIGCEPVELGIVGDDPSALEQAIKEALDADAVLFSGGTSKGQGDYGVATLRTIDGVEVLCHGVAVKPGKPLCLAVCDGKPIAVLPGFPTSCIFTFHEFVAPVLRRLGGQPRASAPTVEARLPTRVNSERGRTEFALISLLASDEGLIAYPIGKGSGSVTTFSQADGFITIDRQVEYLESGDTVAVTRLGHDLEPPDLVVMGSQCTGLDYLLACLRDEGLSSRVISLGSQGGFLAAARGECDIAGVHLCDADGSYNTPFVESGVSLVRGYLRQQGIVSRTTDVDPKVDRMVNRNRGSGTRVVIEELLGDARPPGYPFEVRSHNAVAAAVAQGRADWGVAIRNVAAPSGLSFQPLCHECFDFAIPDVRRQRPAVRRFVELLARADVREGLVARGFSLAEEG
ncbi:MAG: molybdopterin biosynthesis protein [Planctomycetota bacterium]